jgi:hypothetical protein
MNGGVQYANGSEAAGSAVYLHHAAIINTGPEAKDGTCARPEYDLFFSTGNERSRIIYNNPNATQQAGYYLQHSDKFLLQSEIINNVLEEQEVWVYMKYQYITGKPPGHQQTKVVWLSTEGTPCGRKLDLASLLGGGPQPKLGAGEMYPPNEKSFTLKSESWTSPWSGNLVAIGRVTFLGNSFQTDVSLLGGHLHDGGINAAIYQNDKLLCDSRASYAMGNSTGMGGGHSTTAARHLASMSGCLSSDAVKAGDKFHIIVNYDFEKYPGYFNISDQIFRANCILRMRDKDDKMMPIMAAATLFIGAN